MILTLMLRIKVCDGGLKCSDYVRHLSQKSCIAVMAG